MLDFTLDTPEKSSLDFTNDLKNRHKIEMLDIDKLKLNPLNPKFDTDEEIKELADKIYHHPKGIIDTLACYRDDDGLYMLLSGHKRLKALRYNVEHQNELDGTGHIQKNVNCIVVSKPVDQIEEQELIMDYNGYRKFETIKQKKALFYQGYQLYALKKLTGSFKGKARESIAKSTGLGITFTGECKKELEDVVFKLIICYIEEVNSGKDVGDKYEYISKKTKLPLETVKVAIKNIKKDIKKGERKKPNETEETDEIDVELNEKLSAIRKYAEEKLNCKVKMKIKKDKFTITINASTEDYQDILKGLGLDYDF